MKIIKKPTREVKSQKGEKVIFLSLEREAQPNCSIEEEERRWIREHFREAKWLEIAGLNC